MSDYIRITPFPIPKTYRMTRQDIQALLEATSAFMDIELNYISIARTFGLYNIISEDVLSDMCKVFRKDSQCLRKDELFRLFFAVIVRYVSIDDFITGLEREGHGKFALALHSQRYCLQSCYQRYVVIPNVKLLNKLFQNLKRYIDNGSFKETRSGLKMMVDNLSLKLKTEQNPGKRQWLGDEFAVITYLRVQQYRETKERRLILDDLNASFPKDSDARLAEIVVNSKLSSTEQHAGNFNLALDYVNHAKSLTSMCEPSFVSVLVLHDNQFVYRKQFDREPTDENVIKVLNACQMGIYSLQHDTEESRVFWKRIFLLNMTQVLLGIGTFLQIDVFRKLPKGYKKRATHILDEVRNTLFQDIETRRKMIYLLCIGRVHEKNKYLSRAIENVEMAKTEAKDGGAFRPLEIQNIDKYLEFLHEKVETRAQENSYYSI